MNDAGIFSKRQYRWLNREIVCFAATLLFYALTAFHATGITLALLFASRLFLLGFALMTFAVSLGAMIENRATRREFRDGLLCMLLSVTMPLACCLTL